MCLRALLLAAVLFCSESSVHISPEKVNVSPVKVNVSAGGIVILPCSFPPKDVFPTVEWSKEDLKKGFVFLFRDNREDLEMKSPLYASRTNLFLEHLKSGNASLRISNVQPADTGTYRCMRMWNNGQQNITKVELFVAVPDPKISVMPLKEGGFTLECEATCWGSDAKINFLDENGKNLTADDPKKGYPRGCFTVQRRVTLQEAASRVTCRVQRADTNETRETQIQLPAVPDPKISVILLKEGGFTLECEATCWGPDAKITFLDENRKNLSADDPKKNVSRGCYTVQRRVTLQEAASRVTCRVQRADTNETRETQIQLPVEEPKSCSHIVLVTIAVIVLVAVAVIVLVTVAVTVLVLRCRSALVDSRWRKCCKTEQSTLTDIKVDNAENETIEKLQTEVAALKSERNKDKETICKLNKDIAQLTEEFAALKQELDEMNQQDGESSHLLPPPKSSSLHKRLSPLINKPSITFGDSTETSVSCFRSKSN
ncbi:hypothetical protein OYC64_001279 [Pagothenia borchgrevinki]|uniref:Ig-like domain-containing protein n=1 Tax=Pagothenia borchgrevinki TaxID=8213 RepID=A0ABD2GC68_PAGBO